jgi:hypothetical protein
MRPGRDGDGQQRDGHGIALPRRSTSDTERRRLEHGAFHDPAVDAQAGAVWFAMASDAGLNFFAAQGPSVLSWS